MRSKLLIGVALVIAIIGVGIGIALLAARTPGNPLPVAQNPASTGHSGGPDGIKPANVQPPPMDVRPVASTDSIPLMQTSGSNDLAAVANTNASELETNWEDKIDDIVGSDDPDTNKVKQLFALFPKLPPDGQEEAAQHLSNLVEDDDYAPLGDLLKNDKLPEGVLDELLADVLNRPNALKLPLLLDVASDASHAKHDEAKDLLELYLGEDYGSDWNSWGTHLTNWMQQNPD